MQLIIHRGTHEIGGSCIELATNESAILLDVGLPLDCSLAKAIDSSLPKPLFDDLREGKKKLDAVILSHAHPDHYGLVGYLPREIPVYCGEASATLIHLSGQVRDGDISKFKFLAFRDRQSFRVGDFTITPYLVDHSAFDAYAFLVSSGGKNIFYSGDFRAHGRKAKLVDRLKENPPKVDTLLIEGTLIGERSEEPVLSENELIEQFVRVIDETSGIVLVTTAGQNIDRLVTIFKAAKRTNRIFIIDFYVAEIFDRLKSHGNLPQASWQMIRVCYPQLIARRFEKLGLHDLMERHRGNGIRWTRINEIEGKAVMLIRPGFMPNIKRYLTLKGATWIYSMWHGYFEQSESLRNLRNYLKEKDVRIEELHTSGHATISELTDLANALSPKMVIPIHTFHPQKFKDHFSNVRLVNNGEELDI
jgi:ribonuclease J